MNGALRRRRSHHKSAPGRRVHPNSQPPTPARDTHRNSPAWQRRRGSADPRPERRRSSHYSSGLVKRPVALCSLDRRHLILQRRHYFDRGHQRRDTAALALDCSTSNGNLPAPTIRAASTAWASIPVRSSIRVRPAMMMSSHHERLNCFQGLRVSPLATAHARNRHVLVSLPRIEALLEEGGRYFRHARHRRGHRADASTAGTASTRRHGGPRYATLLRDWQDSGGDRDAFARILRKRLCAPASSNPGGAIRRSRKHSITCGPRADLRRTTRGSTDQRVVTRSPADRAQFSRTLCISALFAPIKVASPLLQVDEIPVGPFIDELVLIAFGATVACRRTAR